MLRTLYQAGRATHCPVGGCSEDGLREAYHALKSGAAARVDGETWEASGEGLEGNLADLNRRVHTGAYRATPSRRVRIPKPRGGTRPLGVATLEDKIVQRAVVDNILTPIYEEDSLGFSYGFRAGRGAPCPRWCTPWNGRKLSGSWMRTAGSFWCMPKGLTTDIQDAVWLARVCQSGLARPNYVPSREFSDLRQQCRCQRKVVADRARIRNRLQKTLGHHGLRLGGVLSDLLGLKGGRILDGPVQRNRFGRILKQLTSHMRDRLELTARTLEARLSHAAVAPVPSAAGLHCGERSLAGAG